MKKLLLVLTILTTILVGCSKNEGVAPQNKDHYLTLDTFNVFGIHSYIIIDSAHTTHYRYGEVGKIDTVRSGDEVSWILVPYPNSITRVRLTLDGKVILDEYKPGYDNPASGYIIP